MPPVKPESDMTDVKPPLTCWAITRFDPGIGEKRVIDIYLNPEDAQVDAGAFGPRFVEVEPWLIHATAQYTSKEPAWEVDSDDFDTPIHVPGEVVH